MAESSDFALEAEYCAMLEAVQFAAAHELSHHVTIESDNMTLISCLNNKGMKPEWRSSIVIDKILCYGPSRRNHCFKWILRPSG